MRGSRYAWDMRLISIERLIKLVQIKEKSDDPATIIQIRQLLQPFEYTKIDRIIDVIFTTATDVEEQVVERAPIEAPDTSRQGWKQERTDPDSLNSKRLAAVDALHVQRAQSLCGIAGPCFGVLIRVCACAVPCRSVTKAITSHTGMPSIPTGTIFFPRGRTVFSYFHAWIAMRHTLCPILRLTKIKRIST